jgi:hypothetical protein
VAEINNRSLKFAVLEVLASTRHAHRFTLLGRGSDKGALEHHLGVRFEPSDRQLADFGFQELIAAGLIRSTYEDTVDPGSWVEITADGRRALERRQLDDLDAALGAISPALVELRDGAWAAVTSRRPDSLRQASHSARELIDRVLKGGAPDELVRRTAGFQEDSSSFGHYPPTSHPFPHAEESRLSIGIRFDRG